LSKKRKILLPTFGLKSHRLFHLIAPEQQSAKSTAFTEVITQADDRENGIPTYPLTSYSRRTGGFSFSQTGLVSWIFFLFRINNDTV